MADDQVSRKRYSQRPPLAVRRTPGLPSRRSPSISGGPPLSLDWPAWLQRIERKRRLLLRNQEIAPLAPAAVPAALQEYFVWSTCSSFSQDGIALTERDVIQALQHGPAQRRFRARPAQRVRNHVAILHSIETSLRLSRPLKPGAVVRWYTSISCGLCATELGEGRMSRLDQFTRRINSPQLRLQPALQEIARTYADVLSDPLFPSFNGILSRLLLRYHLGRCGLPFAVFDNGEGNWRVTAPQPLAVTENMLTLQLLVAIDRAYDMLLT